MVEKISGAAPVPPPPASPQLARGLHDEMRKLINAFKGLDPSNPDHLANIADIVATLHRLSREAEQC